MKRVLVLVDHVQGLGHLALLVRSLQDEALSARLHPLTRPALRGRHDAQEMHAAIDTQLIDLTPSGLIISVWITSTPLSRKENPTSAVRSTTVLRPNLLKNAKNDLIRSVHFKIKARVST